MTSTARRVVGRSVPRVDGREKVTGRARYASDGSLPGMAWAKILRSPHPSARIVRLDTGAALAIPGVLAVLAGDDLDACGVQPVFGPAYKDQPILARGVVRYEGEPVAAVAALDEETAAQAVEAIRVEYEPLPVVADIDAALAPGAPLVQPEPARPAGHFRDLADVTGRERDNVCHRARVAWGDVAQGFAAADRIFEHTFTFPPICHVSLEPYASLAAWDGGRLCVWSSTQHPHPVRKELAEIFGLELSAVRVVVPYIGGAYGNKCYTKYEPLAALLALRAGRPVRLVVSLDEVFRTVTRHGARITLKTGVTRDGLITARHARLWLDTGAYADIGPRVAKKAAYRAFGAYRIPHALAESLAVFTHKVPAGAFRGYGAPQTHWAGESQMDVIAEELGIDPLELRLRNLVRRGERWAPADTPVDGDLEQGLRAVARGAGWPRPNAGLAVAFKDSGGAHTTAQATVRVHADGSATVQVAAVEMGQGMMTVMAQIVAEELGLPFEAVRVLIPDTQVAPYDQGISASRGTTVVGAAVWQAARECRELLDEYGPLPPGDQAAVAASIQRRYGGPGGEVIGRGRIRPGDLTAGATVFWEAGMGAAEIELDRDTGVIRVTRYTSAADVGTAINPLLTEGQDEGAAMFGIGHTLAEHMAFTGGQLLNGSILDYRLPGFADLPDAFGSILVENGDGPGPFGCKGVGESGIVGVAPAIGNALARLAGVRLYDLPLLPERVWRALHAS